MKTKSHLNQNHLWSYQSCPLMILHPVWDDLALQLNLQSDMVFAVGAGDSDSRGYRPPSQRCTLCRQGQQWSEQATMFLVGLFLDPVNSLQQVKPQLVKQLSNIHHYLSNVTVATYKGQNSRTHTHVFWPKQQTSNNYLKLRD